MKIEYTFNKYVAVSVGLKMTSNSPKQPLHRGFARWADPGAALRESDETNGYNDTSAAKARPAEYPGVVRVQWNRFAADRLLSALRFGG